MRKLQTMVHQPIDPPRQPPSHPAPSALSDRHQLPRLDLLRSFEASARHLSFTLAAQELFLTQSAVSRQIQNLEEDLGLPLFERRHRALALTPAGVAMLRVVQDCLERLRSATQSLRAQAQRAVQARQVSITSTPGFASLWLIPRLARFTARHPQVEVRLSATLDLEDMDRKGLDLAVRLVGHDRALADAQAVGQPLVPLFEEQIMPVCAPSLLQDPANPLTEPADLARHTLLLQQPDQRPGGPHFAVMDDWEPWLNLMGLREVHGVNTLHFNTFNDAVAAALAGQGVMMGRFPLLEAYLQARQLVAPLAGQAASQRGYYLFMARRAQSNPDAQAFAQWLMEEAKG
jgi:LysR family transcriptional regulator, glycine cleavage system transcriptional activator